VRTTNIAQPDFLGTAQLAMAGTVWLKASALWAAILVPAVLNGILREMARLPLAAPAMNGGKHV
jgi:hypothetical protein